MPFGPYGSFDECVSKSHDKSNPEAFCAWLEHEITGKWPGEMVAGLPQNLQESFWNTFTQEKTSGSDEALAYSKAVAVIQAGGFQWRNSNWVKVQKMSLVTREVREVQIFAVGTHNGDKYTVEDLDQMVAAFEKLKGRIDPPLKIGHTSDEFNIELAKALGVPPAMITGEDGQGAMALGWISGLKRDGYILVADFSEVPIPIAELIASGSYKKVSAEILFDVEDKGKTFPKVLSAVALLGAELPAVRDIKDLDKAVVFTKIGKPSAVIEFALGDEGLTYEDLEPSLIAVEEAMENVIKGRPGARVLRTLWSEVRKKVRTMFDKKKHSQHQDEPPAEWLENCIKAASSWEGVSDAEAFCRGVWTNNTPPLKDSFNVKREGDDMSKEILEALGLQDGATPEQALEAIKELKAKMPGSQLALVLGLAEDATPEQIVAAINDLKQKANGGGTQAQYTEMQSEIAKLKDQVKAGERARRVAVYTDKARAWTAISGKPEEIAEELVGLEDKDPEVAKRQIARFEAENAALVAAGITTPIGSSAEGKTDEEHPFEKKTREKAEKDGLSYAVAFAELSKSDRPGYHEYMKQRRA